MPGSEIFERALRAAAGVTGVLRRGAAIGVAAGALAAAGCSTPATRAAPSNHPDSMASVPIDAAVAIDARTCADDPGWGSPCCEAAVAAHDVPAACQAWGPPAPPAYRGEVLA